MVMLMPVVMAKMLLMIRVIRMSPTTRAQRPSDQENAESILFYGGQRQDPKSLFSDFLSSDTRWYVEP